MDDRARAIDAVVKLNHRAEAAADQAVYDLLTAAKTDTLKTLIELGSYPDGIVNEQVTWQAKKVLHNREGVWS
jgi:hypothetical protein